VIIIPRWRGKHFNKEVYSIGGRQKSRIDIKLHKSATQLQMIRITKAGYKNKNASLFNEAFKKE